MNETARPTNLNSYKVTQRAGKNKTMCVGSTKGPKNSNRYVNGKNVENSVKDGLLIEN